MSPQSTRFVLIIAALLIGLYALEPYVRAYVFTATAPRAIEARGDLAEFERTSITLFERVSPSVVQVVVIGGRANSFDGAQENNELKAQGTGTGFVWDGAGNVVTNAHVVGSSRKVAIRTASGSFIAADVIGVAPRLRK
jgi:2-alkenal reductase